jgi:hypothetical protein
MAISYPLLNGFRHSNAQAEARVNGNIVLGITEANYTVTGNQQSVYAQGALPIGQTMGKFEFKADVSMLIEEFHQLIAALGEGFMLVPIDFVFTYDNPGGGLSVIVDTVIGARITSVENAGWSAGSSDAITKKLELLPAAILFDGKRPGPAQLTAN